MKNVILFLFILSISGIHAQDSYLYYLGLGRKEIIRMDTTGHTAVMLKGRLTGAAGIYFDQFEEKIYWITANEQYTECSNGQLFRANRDGSNIELVLESSLFYNSFGFKLAFSVDSPNDKIYFIAEDEGDLIEMNLSTSEYTILGDNSYKIDFYLDHTHQLIYYTSFLGVNEYDIESGSSELLFSLSNPGPLTVDTISNQLYCSGLLNQGEEAAIYQADLESSEITIIRSGIYVDYEYLIVDQEGEYLYWTENNYVYRAELNGDNPEVIWGEGDAQTLQFAFDPVHREIYWGSPWWNKDNVYKANPDSVIPQSVIEHDFGRIQHMLIDETNQLIYWAENLGKISYADYDFNTVNTIQLNQLISPAEIALDANSGVIYWSDFQDKQIHRASLADGQVELWSNEEAEIFATFITHLQIDNETGELFWYDNEHSAIKKSSLDYYDPITMYTSSSLERSFTLDKTNKKVLWIEEQNDNYVLMSMNYDGSDVEFIPQDAPLEVSFRGVSINGDHLVLRRYAYHSDIYLSNDGGRNFFPWSVSCQPVELFMVGDFFISDLVNQKNLLSRNDFQLSPNPAKNYIHLRFNGASLPEGPFQANLFSSIGRKIRYYTITDVNTKLDLSDIPTGLYYLQLRSNRGQTYPSQKIIVISN